MNSPDFNFSDLTEIYNLKNKDRERLALPDKLNLKNAVKALKVKLDLEDWFTLLVACQGHKVP